MVYIMYKIHINCLPAGNYWKQTSNKRELLLKYAKKKKFDPLVPANWEQNKRQLRVNFINLLILVLFFNLFLYDRCNHM